MISEHSSEYQTGRRAKPNREDSRRIAIRPATFVVGLLLPALAFAQGVSPCDVNKDGTVNSLDVNLAVGMALGTTACTVSIEGANLCTVITVQRIINASQGQPCVSYNNHAATLNWAASTSANVVGYNIYRSANPSGPYTRINVGGVITTGTTYTDTSVQAGQTYYYVATAVDTAGNESAYSNQATAAIPTP